MPLAACLAFTSPAWAGGYTTTDLSSLAGGAPFRVVDINNYGQIVGNKLPYNSSDQFSIFLQEAVAHPILLSNGVATELSTLGGSWSFANGINNNGQVVGTSTTDNERWRPFVYSNGTMTNLGTLPGGNSASGIGINDNGQVVGGANGASGSGQGYLYSNGSMTALGHFTNGQQFSTANSINNSGQVVGSSDAQSRNVAFLYSNGVMTNLGFLSGGFWGSSTGTSINDHGQVVGITTVDMPVSHGGDLPHHAFLYENGKMKDLGTLGRDGAGYYQTESTRAHDINIKGQVVGSSNGWRNNNRYESAFLYDKDGMIDLNTLLPTDSGWILKDAFAINDLGQIVGEGYVNGIIDNEAIHSFLLSPSDVNNVMIPIVPAPAVPLPASTWLLASGLLGLAGIARKRKTA